MGTFNFSSTSQGVIYNGTVDNSYKEYLNNLSNSNFFTLSDTREYDGKISIYDLEDEIDDIVFPEERDYDTLGGLILDKLEDIPKKEEFFTLQFPPIATPDEIQQLSPIVTFLSIKVNGSIFTDFPITAFSSIKFKDLIIFFLQ